MKIIIFQDYLRVGGTERQAVAIANAAAQAGHVVTLLTCRPGGPTAKLIGKGVRHRSLQPLDSGIDEWAPGLRSTIGLLRPDVLVCMGQVTNLMLPRMRGWVPRLVATVRTGKRLSRSLIKGYNVADLVITNAFAHQAALTALGIRAQVEVVGNGLLVEPTVDPAARLLLRRKMGADEETPVVLCLQRLIPGKAQHYLMENFVCAAHQLKAQLWIVGNGPMNLPLKAYARILAPDQIKVMAPEFPLAYYYNAADIAATMSHEDALPNFLIEAQAFSLPCICEDYGGCGEVVIDGLTGFVVPINNDARTTAALQQLIVSAPLRQLMGENGRRLSFRFDPVRQQSRMLELITNL